MMIRNPESELLAITVYVRGAYRDAAYLHLEFLPEGGETVITEIFDSAGRQLDEDTGEDDDWSEICTQLSLIGMTHAVAETRAEHRGCWTVALPTAANHHHVLASLHNAQAQVYTSPESPHVFEARSDLPGNAVRSAGMITLDPAVDAATAARLLRATLTLITGDKSVYVHVVPRDDPEGPDWSRTGAAEPD